MGKEQRQGPRDQSWIDDKRRARMNLIDNLPVDVRKMVHEYGLNVVTAMMDCGVTKPKHMRHIVNSILDEFSPSRGSFSHQGPRGPLSMPESTNQ